MKKRFIVLMVCILSVIFVNNSFSLGAEATIKSKDEAKVVDFSFGSGYCLAVKSDGTLWAWGSNQYGQLGDGTQSDKTVPVRVGKDSDWAKAAAGTNHSLGIKKDGTLWSWGYNVCGQLGDGTTTNRLKPVKISNDKAFVKIAAGGNYSLAIKKDGTLWESGDINRSALDAKNMYKAKLRKFGTAANWVDISVSLTHVLTLKKDGTVWAWGAGGNGQLGDGKESNNTGIPVQAGKDKDWIKVSAGVSYTIAQKKDGSLWRWGTDGYKNILEPAKIGKDTDWVCFSAGTFTTAVKSDGTIWSWGYDNSRGNINEISKMPTSNPVKVSEEEGWHSVASGYGSAVALKKDGTLWSWGYSRYGEMGIGYSTMKLIPTCVDMENNWAQVSAGYYHTLAIKSDGTLWSWGSNDFGKCGVFSQGKSVERPIQVGKDNNWLKVLSTGHSSIALKSDGTIWGWGSNDPRILGEYPAKLSYLPVKVGKDSDWADISGSVGLIFGLKKDGTLWIWGTDINSTLFNGTNKERWSSIQPVKVGKDNDWSIISAGGIFAAPYVMALKKDGSLWAWGFKGYAMENNETYRDGQNFLRIGSSSEWKEISAGTLYAAAIKKDGSLWYWDMEKPRTNFKADTTPIQLGKDKNWKQVSSLARHVLLMKNDGTLWGMGVNNSGEIGDSTRIDRQEPVIIAKGSKWKYISAGLWYSFGIMDDGSLWSWGENSNRQLGIEYPVYRAEPQNIIFK